MKRILVFLFCLFMFSGCIIHFCKAEATPTPTQIQVGIIVLSVPTIPNGDGYKPAVPDNSDIFINAGVEYDAEYKRCKITLLTHTLQELLTRIADYPQFQITVVSVDTMPTHTITPTAVIQ